MPRFPKPTIYREHYTTTAGGTGRVVLCHVSEGLELAKAKLAEHLAVLAELAGLAEPPGRPAGGLLTVGGFVRRFMEHAKVYYRLPNGKPSKELVEFGRSFREVLSLCTPLPVGNFTKKDLKAARDAMIAAGLSRKVVNQRVGRIVRAFRWGAEEEIVPDQVAAALMLVRPLQRGRSRAPEREEVEPVPVADVEATMPHVGAAVGYMIQLQLLTGMRPGEVVALCRSEVKTAAEPWTIDLSHRHKMAYKGAKRVIVVGPKARSVLHVLIESRVTRKSDWFFFRPCEAGSGERSYREHYSTNAYAKAVRMACRRAGVTGWHPNQLRHTFATEVRSRFGLEAAQVMLGHGRADVTQVYAERDLKAAERVAAEMG
jgi:integrase